MSLVNKLTQKKKYEKPTVEIVDFASKDILTLSAENDMEMAKKQKNNDKQMSNIDYKQELSFYEKYPDGLPLTVLEYIDYSKFGAMLKQERLLPPSYDRKPIKVEIDGVCDKPRVILTFKSSTSESIRIFSIYGYSVASSAKSEHSITILEVKHGMSEVWRDFAEKVMWSWDRGYRSSLMDYERKGDTPTSRYYKDEQSLKRLRELEEERQMAEKASKKVAEWFKRFDENNNELN